MLAKKVARAMGVFLVSTMISAGRARNIAKADMPNDDRTVESSYCCCVGVREGRLVLFVCHPPMRQRKWFNIVDDYVILLDFGDLRLLFFTCDFEILPSVSRYTIFHAREYIVSALS